MKILSFQSLPISKSHLNLKYTLMNGQCFNWFPKNTQYTAFYGILKEYYIEI